MIAPQEKKVVWKLDLQALKASDFLDDTDTRGSSTSSAYMYNPTSEPLLGHAAMYKAQGS